MVDLPADDGGLGVLVRAAELASLERAVSVGGSATVVLGPVGIGRSWLLEWTAEHAARAGATVRRVAGAAEESALQYAGLHQLLHQDVEQVDARLPARQRSALLGALGYDDRLDDDPLLVATAVHSALLLRAAAAPLVLLVDDAQWLDAASLRVLAFVARRLTSERVSLVLAHRGTAAPAGFGRGVPVLELRPLPPPDAAALLDGLPVVPAGRTRTAVLVAAGGLPLALHELGTAYAGDPTSERTVLFEPLPLPPALATAFPVDLDGLPAGTLAALAVLAVADEGDLVPPPTGWAAAAPEWAPAVARGLLTVSGRSARFAHPLLRAAVFHALPAGTRRAAHLRWAGAPDAPPARAAWHRARALVGPDDVVAAELAAVAGAAWTEGRWTEAGAAWEAAALVTADVTAAGRHLRKALRAATGTGHVVTARRLADDVLCTSPDPRTRDEATRTVGWLGALDGRHDAAVDVLVELAGRGPEAPTDLRWDALAPATTCAYHLGRVTVRRRVLAAADEARTRNGDVRDPERALAAAAVDAWVQVGTGALAGRRGRELVASLARALPDRRLPELGAAAWVVDDTLLAVHRLETFTAAAAGELHGPSLQLLGWALLELGRWDDASACWRRAVAVARTWGQATVEASSLAGVAHLAAARGERAAVETAALTATRLLDPSTSAAVAVRALHARGLAALSAGDHEGAWVHLSQLVTGSDRPRHFHAGSYAVADLAEAAVRSGHRDRARQVLDGLDEVSGADPSPRVAQVTSHARAVVLADTGRPADAERWFAAAVSDPEGETWPFERARLRLAHGRWLRRGRRITEAREPLERAAAEFARLRATPWLAVAAHELRAAGAPRRAEADGGELSALTPTEQEIVRLAAGGLTNRDIGDRLFLSPRTVGSHLYRIFPKLGVTTRTQLRAHVDAEA